MHHPLQQDRRRRHRSVCLFGLSADPPTGIQGHMGIVHALQQQGEWDEVWVLPVYRHTFSDKRNRLVSFEHRLAMCQAAFADLTFSSGSNTRVVVSDAERSSWQHAVKDISDESERARVSLGTAALLDYFMHHDVDSCNNTTDFFFCLGADAFLDLMAGKWKESDRVLQLLDGGRRLVVLHRNSSNNNNNLEDAEPTHRPANDSELLRRRVQETGARLMRVGHLGSVSSSQVRACRDAEQLRTMVVPSVLEYMQSNRLYQFATTSASSASPGRENDT